MLVIFTVILLGLLVLGLPVAFSLGTAGLFGMFAFMGGGSSLAQIPILAYKSLDDFVLTGCPIIYFNEPDSFNRQSRQRFI